MDEQKAYSPLIDSLQGTFESCAAGGARYMLVYWQGWGERVAIETVAKGQYPWDVHDRYMARDNAASILAIAFDLKRDFAAQMPEHMRQFNTLEGFAFMPMIHIPDRSGEIPFDRQERERDAIINPRPALRLVT